MEFYPVSLSQPTQETLLRVRSDPTHPRFHLCAPAGWMNDPNGKVVSRRRDVEGVVEIRLERRVHRGELQF